MVLTEKSKTDQNLKQDINDVILSHFFNQYKIFRQKQNETDNYDTGREQGRQGTQAFSRIYIFSCFLFLFFTQDSC